MIIQEIRKLCRALRLGQDKGAEWPWLWKSLKYSLFNFKLWEDDIKLVLWVCFPWWDVSGVRRFHSTIMFDLGFLLIRHVVYIYCSRFLEYFDCCPFFTNIASFLVLRRIGILVLDPSQILRQTTIYKTNSFHISCNCIEIGLKLGSFCIFV